MATAARASRIVNRVSTARTIVGPGHSGSAQGRHGEHSHDEQHATGHGHGRVQPGCQVRAVREEGAERGHPEGRARLAGGVAGGRRSTGMWSIGETAAKLGVAVSAPSYWDERGLVCPATRRSGKRLYGEAELHRLTIVKMLQDTGLLSLDDIALIKSEGAPRKIPGGPITEKRVSRPRSPAGADPGLRR